MRTFRLLSCAALIAMAASAAMAEPVFYCKDAKDRLVASDRPCGAASAGQPAEAMVPGYVADRIRADDIFSARNKMREGDKPMPEGAAATADSRTVNNY